jgi:hypothetical protein
MKAGKPALKSPHNSHLFTVEEANRTLPLVRAIVADLAKLSHEVLERRRRLSLLMTGRDEASTGRSHDPYREELVQIEEEVEKDSRQLQEYANELRALGIQPASGAEGLVDFPAVVEGRQAFLSWKLGETQVAHWHEPGSNSRRKPLGCKGVRIA